MKQAARIGAFAAFFALPLTAQAATFSVDPVAVSLAKSNSSTTVSVTNQSSDKLRLQVTGFAWEQKRDGQMELTPTTELVFFPPLLTLDAGETRRIRVGSTILQGTLEKTFRIFMEELPSLESVVKKNGPQISLRMKIGVPVFVQPSSAPVLTASFHDLTVRDESLAFDFANTGNTHLSVTKVRITGKNASGAKIFSQSMAGWYVLAGGTRQFAVNVPKGACRDVAAVDVAVETPISSYSNTFASPNKECRSAAGR